MRGQSPLAQPGVDQSDAADMACQTVNVSVNFLRLGMFRDISGNVLEGCDIDIDVLYFPMSADFKNYFNE